MTYDAATTATVAADPALARDAIALATALAVPAGQASPATFLIVNVVRLRDPSVGDSWFRTWRDTYDSTACERAGGVQGHAESVIGSRTVYIGSCVQGVLTYHVRLAAGAVVLSMTSIGSDRLGQRVIDHLAP